MAEPSLSPAVPRGPDFIVIGAPRSGTSWLYVALRDHPQLWLAPVKELHYFDKPKRTRTWLDPYEWRRVRPIRPTPWYFSYLFGKRSDAWYAKLFAQARRKGLISGEATPDYAVLGPAVFRRMHDMNPAIKLVMIMRDPVERSWSAVNNALRKGRIEPPFTIEKAIAWASRKGPLARSRYIDTVERLEEIFPPSKLHLCFFDDLVNQPDRFVTAMLAFLGAREPLPNTRASGPVNAAGRGNPMPAAFARELARILLPSVEALCERFDGPPQAWRERYRRLLGDGGSVAASSFEPNLALSPRGAP